MLTTAAAVTIVFKKLRIPTILGIERGGYATMMPDANMLIAEGDILWLIGAHKDLSRIASHSVGKAGTHHDAAAAGNQQKDD